MPQYFFKYPRRIYNNILSTDLVTRIKIFDKYLDNDDLYYLYDYKEDDTPEIIASKYYKNPELHWIILITNNIFDPNFEFPMPSHVFGKYIEDKYKDAGGVGNLIIENQGTGYVDGYYQQIPLIITNSNELTANGEGILVNLTVSGGQITEDFSIYRGGTGYDANTLFTVANTESFATNGSGFETSIEYFMSGIEYAQTTTEPTFGYQKEIRIIETKFVEIDRSGLEILIVSEPQQILSKAFYTIDKESYYNLYEGTDPHPAEIVQLDNGTEIAYDSIRVPLITIYEYEDFLNESKRQIRLLKEEYYPIVVEEFLKIISKAYA